ncbi:MAG: Helix-turn-helix domain [Chloroflexi bacterium]|nr:Helix-turn-helix domain [Chloroflexota bacterium]
MSNDAVPLHAEQTPSPLRTVPEAAAFLRISVRTTYELIRQYEANPANGGIPSIRIGGTIRIRQADLEALIGVASPPHGAAGLQSSGRRP